MSLVSLGGRAGLIGAVARGKTGLSGLASLGVFDGLRKSNVLLSLAFVLFEAVNCRGAWLIVACMSA
ncbi:hypothetical protein Hanom_Chr01g00011751 [Helianthus anomalus]